MDKDWTERFLLMNAAPHLPVLRLGRPYLSLDHSPVKDHRTGQVRAALSTVTAGMIRKDLQRVHESRAALKAFSVRELIDICAQAGEQFLHRTLPLAKGHTQSPDQFVESLSATSGLPHVMVRRNMQKIHHALTHMKTILNGLTRGLDLSILDRGQGEQFGTRISYYPATRALGLVMPSNSPAVHSLWLPAIPLKIPVILKPGRDEPWTPSRLIQAFIAAGCPAAAFGFYPTDHEGAREILNACGRALLFGDQETTRPYAQNPAVEVHGPGHSKILIGEDRIERWPEYLDVLAASIADNGGRSCVNASAIVVPRFADEIADALARRLGPVTPAPPEADDAPLCAFANPRMAESIDAAIEDGLRTPGAMDVTARYRQGPRRVVFEGGTYLRPTLVRCNSFAHPLANREFLFPYASVVQLPQEAMLEQIGPSLAVTAVTADESFTERLLDSPLIQRLNLGPVNTLKVSWDQPHEGNMFEFLYKRRSIERAT